MEAPASEAFVGRGRELGELGRTLDAARAGSGATVLVAGEAGIGKTRLATELARRARDAGFEVLLGRSIDLVGTELPYQPFVEALRRLGEPWRVDGQTPGSQLRLFEETLALLTEQAAAAPVLLVLEDLHWADTSTLDLVVFLAHNLDTRPVLLLTTCRADEPASAERVRRLADGVRRSGSALVLELGPLEHDELTALLAARAKGSLSAALTDAIAARSEGNPFFAEELLAAGQRSGALPRGLRDLLLQRVAGLDHPTQSLLRLASAAGRDVAYPLLRAITKLPEPDVRESLRRAIDHGVLVADQASGSFRFRHALLAEAVYATILPGARSCTHASRRSWPAAAPRARRSSRRTGRRQDAPRRRSPPRSKRHARRRPSSPPRRRSLISSGHWCCGTPCRPRRSSRGSTSPSCAFGRRSWPARRAPLRARSSLRSARSSWSATATGCAPRSCTSVLAATCSRAAPATPSSPLWSAPSSWHLRIRLPWSARGRLWRSRQACN